MNKKITAGTIIMVVAVAAAVTGFAVRGDSVKISDARIGSVTGTPSSTQLVVTYVASPTPECGRPSGVEVDESQKTVTLTAQIAIDNAAGEQRLCPGVGMSTTKVVTLKSPLGERKVLDAFQLANGEPGVLAVTAP